MNLDIFVELSIVLAITVVITGIMALLRQPSIIGYILSGIIAGPFVLDIISATDTFTALAQKGVALLLFLVGLSLNPKVIHNVGKISLITGVGQVMFTTSIGFIISRALGFSTTVSLYLAFGLAFSSTIVIMKLLSDKKDLETLYGRISVGFLIVQDLIVILFLLVISSFSSGMDITALATETVLKGIGSIAILFLLAIYVLPKFTTVIAKSQEYLFLFSLSWCFIIATIFHTLNFSIEAGALLAGISLSISPYHFEIRAKMRPLRDFFLILFFIMMGSQMIFENILAHVWEIIAFSLFVLIGNPLIVLTIMGILGYTKRNSFLSGLTVAQISEFSLIIVSTGVALGHVTQEILSVITSVALLTFAGSTYMILYSHKIYPVLSPYLSIFERKGRKVDQHSSHTEESHEIILFGYRKIGYDILESLEKIRKKILIIDYDPKIIADLSREGYECKYADADDPDVLDEINFSKAKMIISAIPQTETNLLIIQKIKERNQSAIISVVSHSIDDALGLYEAGATYVIMPHFLGGKHFSTMITKSNLDTDMFLKEKIAHIDNIKYRKQMGHHHPKYLHQ